MADEDFKPELEGYDPIDVALTEKARKYPVTGRLDPMAVLGGVSIAWLATVFEMDPKKVKKLLRKVPPVRITRQGPRYSVAVAAQYLVSPRADIREFLQTAKPTDLPVRFQHQFWAAQEKRQKVEELAGDLWRTEAVVDVLAEAAKAIKGAITTWADNTERAAGLNDEQRKALRMQTDMLLSKLYDVFVTMPERSKHPPAIEELEEVVRKAEIAEGEAEPDYDFGELI